VLKLADALPCNPTLTELNLSDCNLGLAGALVILRAISADPPLTSRPTSPAGLQQQHEAESQSGNYTGLARAPAALRRVVGESRGGDPRQSPPLPAVDTLTYQPSSQSAAVDQAPRRCGVTALNLAANNISGADPAFPHICVAFADALPYIEKLNLASNGIGHEALKRLLRGPLERYPVKRARSTASSKKRGGPLSPTSAKGGSGGGEEAETAPAALRYLNLSGNRLGDAGFAAIAEAITATTVGRQLVFLDLSWNRASHEGVAALGSAISKAAQAATASSPHGTVSAQPSPGATQLPGTVASAATASPGHDTPAFDASQSMSTAARHDGDFSVHAQSPGLPHLPAGGAGTPKSSSPHSPVAGLPPQLQCLKLHYNLSLGRKGALAVAQLLKAETALTSVDLRWTSLGDEGLASLQEALMANRNVLEIPVVGNELDQRGQEALALRLKKRMERGLPPGVITPGMCAW